MEAGSWFSIVSAGALICLLFSGAPQHAAPPNRQGATQETAIEELKTC